MITESHQVIEEYIEPMRITRSVQTGFINVPLTNMLADRGEVVFVTPATFNPFLDNEKITVLQPPYSNVAYSFKKKYGILDVCVFDHMKEEGDFWVALCAWAPMVRKNGVMVFLNSEGEANQKIISEYTLKIGVDYFEITNCADITFVKVK